MSNQNMTLMHAYVKQVTAKLLEDIAFIDVPTLPPEIGAWIGKHFDVRRLNFPYCGADNPFYPFLAQLSNKAAESHNYDAKNVAQGPRFDRLRELHEKILNRSSVESWTVAGWTTHKDAALLFEVYEAVNRLYALAQQLTGRQTEYLINSDIAPPEHKGGIALPEDLVKTFRNRKAIRILEYFWSHPEEFYMIPVSRHVRVNRGATNSYEVISTVRLDIPVRGNTLSFFV